MGSRKQPTSESELEILKVLWSEGPSTIRDVQERVHEEGQTWAYTTVQTLLLRLRAKGYVRSRKSGTAHVYKAVVSRDELLQDQLEEMAEKVCDGSATPLILNLVKGRRFDATEIEQFRELIDDLETESKKKKKTKGRTKSGE